MANYEKKIFYVTQAQYNLLKNGEAVGEYTKIDPNATYFVRPIPDNYKLSWDNDENQIQLLKNGAGLGDPITIQYASYAANAGTASSAGNAYTADKVNNSLIIKSDSGSTEGTNLYTFDGSEPKTINFKSGSNVTLTETPGIITFSSPSLALGTSSGSGNAVTDMTVSGHTIYLKKESTFLTGNESITLSGDVAGSGTTAITTTLKNSGVTAGSYTAPTITVDAKGRITSASSNTIPSIPSISVTDSGTGAFVTDVTSSGHTITLSRGNFTETTLSKVDDTTGDYMTDITVSGHTITEVKEPFAALTISTGLSGSSYKPNAAKTISLTEITPGTAQATQGALWYHGITPEAGKFDGSTTNPSGTTRLNYGGYLYASRLYDNGARVLTAHPAVSAADSINNSGRKYIQDITLDSFGHVTGLATATETVVNTNTTYSIKASTQTSGAGLDLDAGGSGSGTDTVKFVGSGATTVAYTDANTITISSTDNNTVYTHPSYSLGQSAGAETTLTDITLIDSLTTNSTGHLTGATWRKLVAGSNITITPASNGNITIAGIGNTYPTAFAWANGTTSGPTGSLTGTSSTVLFGAIPKATDEQSGIVTTGAQTFGGLKTFNNNIAVGAGTQTWQITDSGSNLLFRAGTTPATKATLDNNGNLTITGKLSATSKSFLIDHPTKSKYKLQYGSLEGPENGVYIRGKLTNSNIIELPEYWTNLVDEDSITVTLTAIGKAQKLFVEDIKNNKIYIKNSNRIDKNINCFYVVYGERKDVDKLEVEMEVK